MTDPRFHFKFLIYRFEFLEFLPIFPVSFCQWTPQLMSVVGVCVLCRLDSECTFAALNFVRVIKSQVYISLVSVFDLIMS